MIILVGTPKKVFKVIYKRYSTNNCIDSDELRSIFTNEIQLDEDLAYLKKLDLIDVDHHWKYQLTTNGRIYYKELCFYWFEKITTSLIFPLIIAFFTALITTILTLLSQNSSLQTQQAVSLFHSISKII